MMFILGECRGHADLVIHRYAQRYPTRETPSHNTFRHLEKNLREHGQLSTPKIRMRQATGEENETAVLELVEESPHTGQRAIAGTIRYQ